MKYRLRPLILAIGVSSICGQALSEGQENKTKAQNGDAQAQYSEASVEWVLENYEESVKWFRKAAEQGHAGAQFSLAECYRLERGVARDIDSSAKWYRKASDQGHSQAQVELGLFYFVGAGVQRDPKEGFLLLRKSADQNNPKAQWALHVHSEDKQEKLHWLIKAAESGERYAQLYLADQYREGKDVPQDFEKALKWYQKASDQGLDKAQIQLSNMYENGLGVSTNLVLAYMWANIASASGDENAIKQRDKLLNILSRDQIAEAQKLSREWKPTKSGPQ